MEGRNDATDGDRRRSLESRSDPLSINDGRGEVLLQLAGWLREGTGSSVCALIEYGPDRSIVGRACCGADASAAQRIAEEEYAFSLLERSAPSAFPARAQIAPFRFGRTILCGTQESGPIVLAFIARGEPGQPYADAKHAELLDYGRRLALRLLALPGATKQTAVSRFLRMRSAPSLYILGATLEVDCYWQSDTRAFSHLAPSRSGKQPHLNPDIELAVRDLIERWKSVPVQKRHARLSVETVSISVSELTGSSATCYAVSIEPLKMREEFSSVIARYRLSAREVDVLTLLARGASTRAIAEKLAIARSTANDHVKSLLRKTSSHSRAQLLSKLLSEEPHESNALNAGDEP